MTPPAARAEHASYGVMARVENFNGRRSENDLPTLPTASTASFDAARDPTMLDATAFDTRGRAATHQLRRKRGRTRTWTNEQLVAVVVAVDAGC